MKKKFLEYQLESEYISPTETILWVVYLMGKKAFWSEKQIIIQGRREKEGRINGWMEETHVYFIFIYLFL